MNARKLQALRNLAERPGTEAEGQLAREILARYEGKRGADIPTDEAGAWAAFRAHMRGETDTSEFIDQMRRYRATWENLTVSCDCGSPRPFKGRCDNTDRHEAIRIEARKYFPKGTRVYYNKWAYKRNCAGVSTGHQSDWGWMRVKFDYLTSARNVRVFSEHGWHLSTEPITDPERLRILREGMEDLERAADSYADAVMADVEAEFHVSRD